MKAKVKVKSVHWRPIRREQSIRVSNTCLSETGWLWHCLLSVWYSKLSSVCHNLISHTCPSIGMLTEDDINSYDSTLCLGSGLSIAWRNTRINFNLNSKLTYKLMILYYRCDQGGDCECLCTAISNFAENCNSIGVHIKWRSKWLCRK